MGVAQVWAMLLGSSDQWQEAREAIRCGKPTRLRLLGLDGTQLARKDVVAWLPALSELLPFCHASSHCV